MQSVFLTSNTSWYLYNFRKSTIRAIQAQGYSVVCLSPLDDFSLRLETELGVKHIALPMVGKSTGVVQELKSLLFIWRTFRRYRPVFVFNFTIKLNLYGGLACILLRLPFANNISGLGTAFIHDSWLFRRVRQVYSWVNRHARHLFFQNEEDLAVFRDTGLLGATPLTLLPGSGVDLEHFGVQPLPEGDQVTFVMIARLLGDKGVREYAGACRLLKAQGLPVRCLLVGPLGVSNHSAITEEEVVAWQGAGFLEYRGATDDVRPVLSESHVLVLPSYREGMPRTVLEAAAMGRPAIVTDVPGCRQAVVAGETGWFCQVRDEQSLAEQMIAVIGMGAGQLQAVGEAARKRMECTFSEKVVVGAYISCLNGINGKD
ncbi:glycosyltransferase family 4 protein [Alcanivorax sp. S6407]|uniref:glycosyltransferase family 4 protein n=1 Tax=Alcanivorax sp. S6407 TaxID=2926424 RepID=UPI001FF6E788|nr:glycosyltransferase family 4 protein [Alcanivorax sp. S6407]MCK0152832.1 glycosyltransferase family 4 protein [Alcanivorax sp. S6407]